LRKKLDTLHNIDNMVFGYRDDGLQPHAAVAYAHRREFTLLSSQGAVYSHGNLSQDVDAHGFAGREFFYTAENNLRQMNSNQLIAPSTTTYGYDGFGQRAWQRLSVPRGGTMTVYYVGPWMDVVVNGAASGSGGPSPTIRTRRHIYAGGMRLMTKTSTPTNWDGDETHYITDYQGSVRATLDQFGNVLTRTNYLPFGQIDEATSTGTIQFGFTGQELGMADGLCFYNARYYDPVLMRFLTPDAIVPDPANNMAFNRYAYVYNNPVSFIDPSGHDPILMASLIGALIGGISGGISGYIAAEEAGRNPWVGALIGAGIGIFAGGAGAGIGDLVGTGVAGAVGGASGSTSSALVAAPAGSTLLGNIVGGAINGAISSFGQALGSGLAAHHVDFGEVAKQTGFGAIQGAFRGRPGAIGNGGLGMGTPPRALMEGVGGLVTSALKGESLGQGFINGFSRGWGIGAGEYLYTGVDAVLNIGSAPFEKGIDAFFSSALGIGFGAPWAIGGLIGWASDSTTHGFSKGSLEGFGYAAGGGLVLGGLHALLSWGN
jgi:RHS repeat-associated protein